jgi:predicted aminopeptidase
VPSAKRETRSRRPIAPARFTALALCGALAVGSLAGCETTQEKAAAQRAQSERILEARAKRQAQKKKRKHHDLEHQKGKR